MNLYSIYKITNNINKKIYIGYTSNVSKRIRDYRSNRDDNPIQRAIRKYGWENFTFEVIYQSLDKVHTHDVMEPIFIKEYNSTAIDVGYNIKLGGNVRGGYVVSAETKLKLSKAMKGRSKSPESIAKQLETKRLNGTLIQTPETRRKAADKVKGTKQSEEWKQKRLNSVRETKANRTPEQIANWKNNLSQSKVGIRQTSEHIASRNTPEIKMKGVATRKANGSYRNTPETLAKIAATKARNKLLRAASQDILSQ